MYSVVMVMSCHCIDIYSIVFRKWFGSFFSFSPATSYSKFIISIKGKKSLFIIGVLWLNRLFSF